MHSSDAQFAAAWTNSGKKEHWFKTVCAKRTTQRGLFNDHMAALKTV